MLIGVPDETAEDCEIRLTAMTMPAGRSRKYRGTAVGGTAVEAAGHGLTDTLGHNGRRPRARLHVVATAPTSPDPTRIVEQVYKLHIVRPDGSTVGHPEQTDAGSAGSASARAIWVPVPRRPGT